MEMRQLGEVRPSKWRPSPSAATFRLDRRRSRFVLAARRVRRCGLQLIDTADSYSRWVPGHNGGESETMIGRWIARRGRHDEVVIATKVGSDMGLGRKCLSRGLHPQGGRAIAAAAAGGLHRPLPVALGRRETPLDETLEAYARADPGRQSAGHRRLQSRRRRGWPRRWRSAAHGLPRYERLQPHVQPVRPRQIRRPARAVCARERIGVITYFSLAAGFLTGKYRRKRTSPRARAARA